MLVSKLLDLVIQSIDATSYDCRGCVILPAKQRSTRTSTSVEAAKWEDQGKVGKYALWLHQVIQVLKNTCEHSPTCSGGMCCFDGVRVVDFPTGNKATQALVWDQGKGRLTLTFSDNTTVLAPLVATGFYTVSHQVEAREIGPIPNEGRNMTTILKMMRNSST